MLREGVDARRGLVPNTDYSTSRKVANGAFHFMPLNTGMIEVISMGRANFPFFSFSPEAL
jgi:hypothetical protein